MKCAVFLLALIAVASDDEVILITIDDISASCPEGYTWRNICTPTVDGECDDKVGFPRVDCARNYVCCYPLQGSCDTKCLRFASTFS